MSPALAVAQALRRSDPGGELLLVGRRGGLEERVVPAAGLRLETLDLRGIDTARPLRSAGAVARIPGAVIRARHMIRELGAEVVAGTAGYVCVPVVLAANSLGVPVALLEQNAYPGRAVRLLARRARVVCTSFAATGSMLRGARVVHTGNPVRPEVLETRPAPLGDRVRRVLVMGGSQGAHRINRAVAGCAGPMLADDAELRLTHQCGARDAELMAGVRAGLAAELRSRYEVAPYFDDMAARIASADLVVMRAGGSSLAEVTVLGRPMILVPYPYAGAHQRDNALPYAQAGAAVVVDDAACDAARLRAEVTGLVGDVPRWRAMATASAAAGRPDAARRVVSLLGEIARRPGASHGDAA